MDAAIKTKRSYGEACAAAHALDLIGERWALLVVRELVLGPKRFTDLKTGIPGASPNVLSQRLRELEAAGVVHRRTLPPPAGSKVYELTEWGAELEPVLQTLGRWGSRSPALPKEATMSVDATVLAMRTMFDAESAGDLDADYELRLGEDIFHARVRDGEFAVDRGPAEDPTATVSTEAGLFAALVLGGYPLQAALDARGVKIDGAPRAVERLIGLFPLREPAELPAPTTA